MHILLLDLGSNLRGSQKQLLSLARLLNVMPDMDMQIACPADSALAEAARGCALPLLGLNAPGGPLTLLKLLSLSRRLSPLLVHTHAPAAACLGSRLKRLAKDRVRLLHTLADAASLDQKNAGRIYARADAAVGVSAEAAHLLLQTGIAPQRVSVIHSCLDASQYPKRRARGDGRFVFGVAGDLCPEKGYGVLVEAVAQLDRKPGLPPWEVRVIGQGPMFNQILEQAGQSGAASHLALLGEQEARDIFPDCDIVIVPSIQAEGSSAAIKQAWAIGLPVIASDLPANMELVRNEDNGLTYLYSNPDALATTMIRAMRDTDLNERMLQSGKASLARFSPERMVTAYLAVYKELSA